MSSRYARQASQVRIVNTVLSIQVKVARALHTQNGMTLNSYRYSLLGEKIDLALCLRWWLLVSGIIYLVEFPLEWRGEEKA